VKTISFSSLLSGPALLPSIPRSRPIFFFLQPWGGLNASRFAVSVQSGSLHWQKLQEPGKQGFNFKLTFLTGFLIIFDEINHDYFVDNGVIDMNFLDIFFFVISEIMTVT
jgi:hypothetical protein